MQQHMTRAVITLLLSFSGLYGQEIIDSNFNAWVVYNGSHAISKNWSLVPELHFRRHEVITAWQQNLYRLSLERTLGHGIAVLGGYTSFHSYRWGQHPIANNTHEHRIHQQISWRQSGNLWRARFEERWIRDNDVTRYQHRLRLLWRRQFPLRQGYYWQASNELWLNVPPHVSTLFDQNRAQISIGHSIAPHLKMEIGYMYQPRMQRNARVLENNHTLVLTFVSDASLRLRRL